MSKFYIASRLQPKSIMMGTSRIGLFPETQLHPYLDGPIYNLSLPGSTIDEQASYIQYMIKSHKVKNVVWSLDFFAFNPTKPIDPAFEPSRLSDSIFWNDYFISLFSFKTLSRSFKTIKSNQFSIPEPDETLGQPFTPKMVNFNINYILHQYATDKTFLKSEVFKSSSSINSKLALVKQTVELCRVYNVSCILYTSPVYYKHIDMIYAIGLGDTFEAWKIGIAQISPYTDFCTYNSITQNKMNFRDSSHIIGHFGEIIFVKIFENNRSKIPQDFGTYVTRHNVFKHVSEQKKMRHPFSFDENLSK